MCGVDTAAVSGVADTVALKLCQQTVSRSAPLGRDEFLKTAAAYQNANIQRLRDPVAGHACREGSGESINVASGGAAIVVDVAGQPRCVLGIADKENALDGVECCASQAGKGIDGGGCALGVAFQDEAFRGVARERGLDAVDYLGGTRVERQLMYQMLFGWTDVVVGYVLSSNLHQSCQRLSSD